MNGWIRTESRAPAGSGFFLVALLVSTLAGCGDGPTDRPTFRLEFDSGLVVRPQTGVFRDTRPSSPNLWLSYPEAAVVLESGSSDPGEQRLRIFNIPPNGQLRIGETRYLTASDREACSGPPNGPVDCRNESDPLCNAVRDNKSVGADTTADLTADLPPCAFVQVRYQFPDPGRQPPTIGLIGPSDRVDGLAEIVERRSSMTSLTVLTGDYVGRSEDRSMAAFARELSGLSEPVVVIPGERERSDISDRSFRSQFGPTTYRWTAGGVNMVVIPTPNQTSEGPEGLDARLEEIGRDEPIVGLTHTPPIDPNGARDRGFRNRTEGMRVMSVLSDYRADGLLAGHLTTRYDRRYGDIRMLTAPPSDTGAKLIVSWPRPSSSSDPGEVRADARVVRP